METQQAALSRRTFIKAMGALSASGAVFLSGCGSQRASEASGSDSAADTITFAQGADPRGLDPAYVDDGESAKIMENIYESLVTYADDSTDIEPCLAKDYEISDDGLTYTFHLEEGVKFHDGTDFNADAVVKSIERQLEPNRTEDMTYASFVFGTASEGNGVESVTAVDDYTVEIKLAAVSAPFIKNMAMILAAPIVCPTDFDALMENPCGTGPYKFVSWDKGQNVKLVANDDYWDEDRKAKTQNIIFRFIAENASRVTALNNGEVDIIDGIDDSVVDTITSAGNSLFEEDGMNINYMAFNCLDTSVCSDQAVRKAIAKAVNVEEMVSSLYGDYASVANSIMPVWMAPYDEDVTQTEYDPDAAQQELADLGITNLTCITYSNVRPYNTKNGQTLAEAVQGYLSKVGVTVDITPYDWTTYKTKVTTDPWDICFYGWVGDNGDPDNFMNLLADTNATMNVAQFQDEEYNALIAQGVATSDEDERAQIYKQCEEMAAEKQPWLLISHSKNLAGYNPNVSGFVIHPTGVVRLWNAVKSA
ncbi:MAG: ABC transporter substrate-binding protein [Tractidigestivibacter sp.]|jgi:peptide/nickel transport system substrate-binding protein|uniref:ABC transporter substrate-binding protein n=1 Tax=Tractidigestivibacter sp. TaxID=2847320 RepID=UPI003D93B8D1